MKLLLKVVKSSLVFSGGDAVQIDNNVKFPTIPKMPEFAPEEGDEAYHIAKEKEAEAIRVEQRIAAEIEHRARILKAEFEKEKKVILDDIETSRLAIIEKASKEAAEIVAKANEEAGAIREYARQIAKEQGFTSGKSEAVAQCEKYVQAAAQFLSGINSKKDAYFISLEDELINTVLEMVKKITLLELKTDSDTIFRILKQASRTFRNDDYLKISFADGDVSQDVITDIDFIRSVVGNIKEIDVEILPDAEEGTIIIDNGSEIIDASIPTQLDLLKEIMKNSRG